MTRRRLDARGSTLVELMATLTIIGAIASIGMPQYLLYTEQSKAAQCQANRVTMEKAEYACALDRGKPCVNTKLLQASGYLDAQPKCPTGGKYVWAGKAADDPNYPHVACSKHGIPGQATAKK